jgi:hypothetical protein
MGDDVCAIEMRKKSAYYRVWDYFGRSFMFVECGIMELADEGV